VRFVLDQKLPAHRLYWIHLPATPGIAWARHADPRDSSALSPTGCTAAELPGPTRWHALTNNQNFTLRLTPAQKPFSPQNVLTGTARPDRWTNIYVSESLPAWIELRLPQQRRVNTIQLTFDTDVNRHSRQPLFVYPDCVKRYDVHAFINGAWARIAGESGNYLRRRVLHFPAVETNRFRIDIHETNGATAARVYEVRLYNEANV
jgi:hypothetical protein